MNKPKHAVGIVVKNRWELTNQCLMSLVYSQQPKNSYDLYLIDNASEFETAEELKRFAASGLLPVKNLLVLKDDASVPRVWNLFLSLTQDYEFRTKLDNDIVLFNTMPSAPPKKSPNAAVPMDALSGAPRSASIIKGGWNSKLSNVRNRAKPDTKFLDQIATYSKSAKSSVTALLPVEPNKPFPPTLIAMCARRYKGRPYLCGGCMTISKAAFDRLGYFDERLPRQIDLEYTQRAIRNRLNIGYHPSYHVLHLGADVPTDGSITYESRMQESNRILDQEKPIESKGESVWNAAEKKVFAACRRTLVVNFD